MKRVRIKGALAITTNAYMCPKPEITLYAADDKNGVTIELDLYDAAQIVEEIRKRAKYIRDSVNEVCDRIEGRR